MDPYMRARTVRIGKWRWPPAKDDSAAAAAAAAGDAKAPADNEEGFLEFKMRKMQERRAKEKRSAGVAGGVEAGPDSLNTSGEIQGIEWGDDSDEDKGHDDFDDFDDAPNRKKISNSAMAMATDR